MALDQGEVADCARRGDGRHLRVAGSHRAVQVARREESINLINNEPINIIFTCGKADRSSSHKFSFCFQEDAIDGSS